MQNIYPLFEQNRIMKKELLWSLRDYSFSALALTYQEYSQGILRGLNVKAEEGALCMGAGMVKFNGFIHLITEPLRIAYTPTEQWEIVKMRFHAEEYAQEYIAYDLQVLLGEEPARQEDELEICRFKLRKGSGLRDTYTDFYDMDTEYDTVNLLHAAWAGIGEPSLPPAVTGYFAGIVLEEKGSTQSDISFAYFCLGQQGAVPRKAVRHYIAGRMGMDLEPSLDNHKIYGYLLGILEDIRLNRDSRVRREHKHSRIIMDY